MCKQDSFLVYQIPLVVAPIKRPDEGQNHLFVLRLNKRLLRFFVNYPHPQIFQLS